jgi:tRNA (cmo5U34)-methyltransferase
MDRQPASWDEQDSRTFIDYGRYFVPDRERQLQTIVDLLPSSEGPFRVIELGCGEGLLAQAILQQYPSCIVYGLDGSTEMRHRARNRLARFGERFQAASFNLADESWRQVDDPVQAVVTSLALHHLDAAQKQRLFRDVYRMLALGGVFVIADLIEPASSAGWALAARAWDEAVRERALELDGTTAGFDRFQQMAWNMYRHFEEEDIDKPSPLFDQLKWLEQAGFDEVDVFWMRAGHAIFGGTRLDNRSRGPKTATGPYGK